MVTFLCTDSALPARLGRKPGGKDGGWAVAGWAAVSPDTPVLAAEVRTGTPARGRSPHARRVGGLARPGTRSFGLGRPYRGVRKNSDAGAEWAGFSRPGTGEVDVPVRNVSPAANEGNRRGRTGEGYRSRRRSAVRCWNRIRDRVPAFGGPWILSHEMLGLFGFLAFAAAGFVAVELGRLRRGRPPRTIRQRVDSPAGPSSITATRCSSRTASGLPDLQPTRPR
jgi:hypothetical protein